MIDPRNSTLHPDARDISGARQDIGARLIISLRHLRLEVNPAFGARHALVQAHLDRPTPCRIDPALHGLHAKRRGAALADDVGLKTHRVAASPAQVDTAKAAFQTGFAMIEAICPDWAAEGALTRHGWRLVENA